MKKEEWQKMSMAEQADAWERMNDQERRAVRPDWRAPVDSERDAKQDAVAEAPSGDIFGGYLDARSEQAAKPRSVELGLCESCGGKVSPRAEKCPHCGDPMTGNARLIYGAGLGVVIFAALVFIAAQWNSAMEPVGADSKTMDVGVRFLPDALEIQNKGSVDLSVVTGYLNDSPPDGYKADFRGPGPGETIEVPLGLFVDRRGNKMDPARHAIVEAWIGGGGYDFERYVVGR